MSRIASVWPVGVEVSQHKVVRSLAKDTAWYLLEVEWSNSARTAYFQRFSFIYDALTELQHEAPGAEALRRIPGKRAFSSASESARTKRAGEINDVLAACVKDPQLQRSPTLIALLSPPHAAPPHGSQVGSELSAADIDRLSRADDATSLASRGDPYMHLSSKALLHHNVAHGAESRSESDVSASQQVPSASGGRPPVDSRVTGTALDRRSGGESFGIQGPGIPQAWPHRTEVQETVMQGDSAVALLQHVHEMAGALQRLRERMVAQEGRMAAVQAENERLRAENDSLRRGRAVEF